jgi:hypothetical protein
MVRATVAVWVMLPLVPVTVMVYGPVVVPGVTIGVQTVVVDPFPPQPLSEARPTIRKVAMARARIDRRLRKGRMRRSPARTMPADPLSQGDVCATVFEPTAGHGIVEAAVELTVRTTLDTWVEEIITEEDAKEQVGRSEAVPVPA